MTTDDIGPYSNYRLTVRLALLNKPGIFAKVAALLAEEGANLGAVDIVSANAERMIRDITFDVQNETHGETGTRTFGKSSGSECAVRVRPDFFAASGRKNTSPEQGSGQYTQRPLHDLHTRSGPRLPGYRQGPEPKPMPSPSRATRVAVVTDGSAVLGLGNLGPAAALPVMEGKVMLFKELAGIDAWPICVATQDAEEIIRIVRGIAPGFGGINLEDISAPRCFEIERPLKASLDIPVMHDDQHGTAVVLLAALTNALKVVGKRMDEVRIVVNGLGAAGTACCRILLAAGACHLVGCDKEGIVLMGEAEELRACRTDLQACIRRRPTTRNLA